MLSKKVFSDGYKVSSGSNVAKQEKNDCVVRAFANGFDIDYDQAHEFVKAKFNRQNRKGTNNTFSTMKSLQNKDLEFERNGQLDLFNGCKVTKRIKYLGSEPKKGGNLKNNDYTHKQVAYTVKTFIDKFKHGTYFVLVNKHALIVKNGQLLDNPDMQFTGYRRVVEHAFKID
tara:strand:+ start:63 stop:578 length:516 start_codon:yes stop_codon:yes gene_type:complete